MRHPLPSRSSSALSSGDRRVAEQRSRPRCCLGCPSVTASGSLDAGNLGASLPLFPPAPGGCIASPARSAPSWAPPPRRADPRQPPAFSAAPRQGRPLPSTRKRSCAHVCCPSRKSEKRTCRRDQRPVAGRSGSATPRYRGQYRCGAIGPVDYPLPRNHGQQHHALDGLVRPRSAHCKSHIDDQLFGCLLWHGIANI